jgi:hypothetical protein
MTYPIDSITVYIVTITNSFDDEYIFYFKEYSGCPYRKSGPDEIGNIIKIDVEIINKDDNIAKIAEINTKKYLSGSVGYITLDDYFDRKSNRVPLYHLEVTKLQRY